MDSALDTIEYLARSPHRVEVLDAVRTGPRTREELRDSVDASRVTVGRIVRDLEERGWIRSNGRQYEVTPRGDYVGREFVGLVRNLEAYESLPPVPEWFPGEEPTFDLSVLADATVVTADEGDLIAPIRRALAFTRRSDPLRVVANGGSAEFVAAMREGVEDGATQALLLPPAAVEAVREDPEMREDVGAMLETGRLTLLRYGGDDPLPVVQVGEAVLLCSGDHRAMVESDHPEVCAWADAYFDSLRAESTRVGVEAFADADGAEAVEADGGAPAE